ncbi:MAG: hypothetical protein MJB57_18195 [Gemmatimonadetes bacterium]|nr:hypothetical protein [Gemmatimonadota bacterium]
MSPAANDPGARAAADSLETDGLPADTLAPVTPLGALARSMIVPGWGQLEVGRPSRAAIYFGAESLFLFMVFKSSQKLSVAKRSVPTNDALVEARTRQRENWIVLAAFTAFMSGIDAWISAQFWDYEPSIGPPADGSVGVALGFEVPVP